MPTCDRCAEDAVEHLAYAGEHLCGDHLERYVERRAKQAVRDQAEIADGTLAVAVSGGKDSLVCLSLLEAVFGVRRDVELVAVTVDEGIEGYRAESLDHVHDVVADLGVRQVTVAYEDRVDVTMDDLVAGEELDGTPCATCGVLRRRFLQAAADRVDADWLATGHNLDDVAQSILMNVLRGDVDRLARMGPHDDRSDGMVPRVMPLRRVPEREVAVYAHLVGLPVQHDECPHNEQAFRGEIRDILHDLEADHPGTRHALVNLQDRLDPALEAVTDDGEPETCPGCGGASSGGLCRSCELLEALGSSRV